MSGTLKLRLKGLRLQCMIATRFLTARCYLLKSILALEDSVQKLVCRLTYSYTCIHYECVRSEIHTWLVLKESDPKDVWNMHIRVY